MTERVVKAFRRLCFSQPDTQIYYQTVKISILEVVCNLT